MSDALGLYVRPDEQCVALTESFRLFQCYRGHRYSVDDMLVAQLAGTMGGKPKQALDLGCGLGSVLLMLAWRFPNTLFQGVEAQPEHVALARRNVCLNDCSARVNIVLGDIREPFQVPAGGFDLVTGTPPYLDPKAATVCSDTQRAYAQWELRGGIEDYAQAAARCLAKDGRFITCASGAPAQRPANALNKVGLHPIWRRDVLPRPDQPPFLSLWIASHQKPDALRQPAPLVLRNNDGTRTEEHISIRQWFGIACSLR